MTSLTLGTGRKRLWLLRSRPDQIGRATMRGGPSVIDSTRVDAPTEAPFRQNMRQGAAVPRARAVGARASVCDFR